MTNLTLLSVKQVAKRLGLTDNEVRGLVSRDQIPYRRIGGRIRFLESALEAWLLDPPVPLVPEPPPARDVAAQRAAECRALGIDINDHPFL